MDTVRDRLTRSGNTDLAAHPSHIAKGPWTNYLIERNATGLGPYQTRRDIYVVTVQGGVPSTKPGYDLPFGTVFNEDRAAAIAQFVHPHKHRFDEDRPWHEEFLARPGIELLDQGDWWYRFRFTIEHPYLD